MPSTQPRRSQLRVVLFSGGRGSGALSLQLVANPQIALTIAINGYDDGASTGEVRRFLGDCLGPSDFRKNASRLARALGTAPTALIDLLDLRLDNDLSDPATASKLTSAVAGEHPFDPRLGKAVGFAASLSQAVRSAVAVRLQRFAQELAASRVPFNFADCSVGNLVFAGGLTREGTEATEQASSQRRRGAEDRGGLPLLASTMADAAAIRRHRRNPLRASRSSASCMR